MKHNKNSRNANHPPTSRNQDGDFLTLRLRMTCVDQQFRRSIVKTNPTGGGHRKLHLAEGIKLYTQKVAISFLCLGEKSDEITANLS